MENAVPAVACNEAEADSLLERGEVQLPSSTRSVRRAVGLGLAGTAALACVLYVAGVQDHRVLAWGRRSAPGVMSAATATDADSFYGYEDAPSPSPAPVSAAAKIAPKEDMDDGSKCGEDEEDFEINCYKKCSILTQGKAPVRTSPWSCCKTEHCTLSEEVFNVKMCDGFDVAGDAEGKGKCPHKEGVCYDNEEISLGVCYKKCSILTNGVYIHRKSAFTCCNKSNLIQCVPMIYPKNTDTKIAYSVGGGKDDGDSSTKAMPHPPIASLTENTSS